MEEVLHRADVEFKAVDDDLVCIASDKLVGWVLWVHSRVKIGPLK